MLDAQNQGPQCTACGSPMRLAAIEPSMWGKDLRTFACLQCKRVQRHIIESAVTEAWLENRSSAAPFSPLGPRGILVLDLANRISRLAKGNQHSLGEVDTFYVTFRDLVPGRAVPRTRMIDESGFDGVCYDDKAVFWHPGSLPAFR